MLPHLGSPEAEVHFNVNAYGDRRSVFLGGLEEPLLYGIDRAFVQSRIESSVDMDFRKAAVRFDNAGEQHGPLDLAFRASGV
jgi:hypothetical protein